MPTDLSHTTIDPTRAYQVLHTLDGNYGILSVLADCCRQICAKMANGGPLHFAAGSAKRACQYWGLVNTAQECQTKRIGSAKWRNTQWMISALVM